MAQKFNDGQTFGAIREILNGNADELNSTTETANEAYKEAGLAMWQANNAKNTANEAKTAADAAEYRKRTNLGGGSLNIGTTSSRADFSQVLATDISTPNAAYMRLIVLSTSSSATIVIPSLNSPYGANCVKFRTLIYGSPSKLTLQLPSGNYSASSTSDKEFTDGIKSWTNSSTYKRALRDFGIPPQGMEVTITLIAGRYAALDIQVRPLFELATGSPAAAALSLEDSPRAEVADAGADAGDECYMNIEFYDASDEAGKEVADAE